MAMEPIAKQEIMKHMEVLSFLSSDIKVVLSRIRSISPAEYNEKNVRELLIQIVENQVEMTRILEAIADKIKE